MRNAMQLKAILKNMAKREEYFRSISFTELYVRKTFGANCSFSLSR